MANANDSNPAAAGNHADTGQIWAELAALRPRLLPHIDIHAQRFRGRRWYVLHDTSSGQHLRLNASAYALIGRLDGTQSLGDAVSICRQHASVNLSPQEVVSLLMRLQAFGALGDFTPIAAQSIVNQRLQRQATRSFRNWSNPLAIRLPLYDPDRLLERWVPGLSLLAPVILLAIGGCALLLLLILTVLNWSELATAMGTAVTTAHNLALVVCLYPLLKGVHEFAHALCLKRAGGEVHEMGVTLLVFIPVPYVDASAAWSIPSRGQRILVSAAGILAELGIATLALLLWLTLEPGLLKDTALVLFSLGSLSTLLFNANPLLRFDGYYMLQDWIEIPNLYSRAQQYLRYLFVRYVLRCSEFEQPVVAEDEKNWLLGYAIGALLYRNLIVLVIAWWLVSTLMLVGVVLALWLVFRQWLMPLLRFMRFVYRSSATTGGWANPAMSTVVMAMVLVLVTTVPVPRQTRVQGMVWVPEQSQLYAGTSGVVSQVRVQIGEAVSAGQILLQLDAPELATEFDVLQARIHVQELKIQASRAQGGIGVALETDELDALKARKQELQQRLQAQVVRSPGQGVFAPRNGRQLEGQYFTQGDLIGHVINRARLLVHVVIPETDIGPVRDGVEAAEVRFAESFNQVATATIVRETPSADYQLPGAALGHAGGGGIPIASGGDGTEALHKVFHLELVVHEDVTVSGVGAKAYVSLQHPASSLGSRAITVARQLFLRHLSGDSA